MLSCVWFFTSNRCWGVIDDVVLGWWQMLRCLYGYGSCGCLLVGLLIAVMVKLYDVYTETGLWFSMAIVCLLVVDSLGQVLSLGVVK